MSTITRDLAASSYSPSVSTSLEPVAPAERITALDLLRGWAMFGVLWSNLNDWYGTADPTTRLDRAFWRCFLSDYGPFAADFSNAL